jgi:hypothetical protein
MATVFMPEAAVAETKLQTVAPSPVEAGKQIVCTYVVKLDLKAKVIRMPFVMRTVCSRQYELYELVKLRTAKKIQKANRKRVKKAAATAGISTSYTKDLAAKLDADNALELAEKMEGCGKDTTASWKHFNTMSAKVGLPEAPAPTAQ